MAVEEDFNWEDDLMTKCVQRQSSHLSKLAQEYGPDYGKPIAGSESEKRSKEYQKNVMSEITSLCQQIADFGKRNSDETDSILFGELFRLNEKISNKCVGILQRARKYRLLHFPGETLWQGKDDNIKITLLRKNREIQLYFSHTGQLLPNGQEGNTWIQINSKKRVHAPWVACVREVSSDVLEYLVQIDNAEFDDAQELPSRCFPLNKDEVLAQGNPTVEPRKEKVALVIFKLRSPVVTLPPILHSLAEEYFEPCLPGEYTEIASFPFMDPIRSQENDYAEEATIQPIPVVKKCRKPSPEKWVRSTSPVRREPQKPVQFFKSHLQKAKPKQITILDVPPVIRIDRNKSLSRQNQKCSIKFSQCTTMYKPPDPVYEGIKKRGVSKP